MNQLVSHRQMFHTLTVKNIIAETPVAATVVFDIPQNLKEVFRYTQGQYVTINCVVNNQPERRAYSICTSPLESDFAITIKRQKGGLVSNFALDNFRIGSLVEVKPPEGRFHTPLDAAQRNNYYLIGTGSGITPLMSIIKTILEIEPQSSIYLLYGNRDEDNIIFKSQLDALQQRYEGQLIVEYILSQPKVKKDGGIMGLFKKETTLWKGKIGRIDSRGFETFLAQYPPTKNAIYYLCGQQGMIETVEAALHQGNVDKKQIHKEYFNTTKDASAVSGDGLASHSKLTVVLEGKIIELELPAHKTVLQALLEQRYEPPYSCTTGSCSTCMAKVTEGKAKMDACYALDDDEVADGYILTCQARALTPTLSVNYDL